jgi:hypothetical protein
VHFTLLAYAPNFNFLSLLIPFARLRPGFFSFSPKLISDVYIKTSEF